MNSSISMSVIVLEPVFLSKVITAELQWLEHLWIHEKMFEIGVVQANDRVIIIPLGQEA